MKNIFASFVVMGIFASGSAFAERTQVYGRGDGRSSSRGLACMDAERDAQRDAETSCRYRGFNYRVQFFNASSCQCTQDGVNGTYYRCTTSGWGTCTND